MDLSMFHQQTSIDDKRYLILGMFQIIDQDYDGAMKMLIFSMNEECTDHQGWKEIALKSSIDKEMTVDDCIVNFFTMTLKITIENLLYTLTTMLRNSEIAISAAKIKIDDSDQDMFTKSIIFTSDDVINKLYDCIMQAFENAYIRINNASTLFQKYVTIKTFGMSGI